MGFLLYFKTRSFVAFHPNVLKGKAGNSGVLFHVMEHFFIIH